MYVESFWSHLSKAQLRHLTGHRFNAIIYIFYKYLFRLLVHTPAGLVGASGQLISVFLAKYTTLLLDK